MGTKTISLRDEAYERLRRARQDPRESFSDVVMRAVWPDAPLTAGDLLALVRERGAVYGSEELRRVEEVTEGDVPATDKWQSS
ncbi:MAG: antitoxin VapB family protein [Gemmatimonadales bacterium]